MNVHVYERLFHWLYATEGPVPYMYLDSLGLVTVGIGFMIDPIEKYIGQWGNSFLKKDGVRATPTEVTAEFRRVKILQNLKGYHPNFEPDAQLFMPGPAMKPRLLEMVRSKESAVTSGWSADFYSDFDSFPPDAQMGVLSTAYGWWANKKPAEQAFNLACKQKDWKAAAESGRWDNWKPEKIRGHQLMFNNAQVAKDTGDTNPIPAFPGTLKADIYEVDDTIKPYRQNIWKAGS